MFTLHKHRVRQPARDAAQRDQGRLPNLLQDVVVRHRRLVCEAAIFEPAQGSKTENAILGPGNRGISSDARLGDLLGELGGFVENVAVQEMDSALACALAERRLSQDV
jgi:hypothetical protein